MKSTVTHNCLALLLVRTVFLCGKDTLELLGTKEMRLIFQQSLPVCLRSGRSFQMCDRKNATGLCK